MQTADLIIRNPAIVDGTDQPAFKGDRRRCGKNYGGWPSPAASAKNRRNRRHSRAGIHRHSHTLRPQLCWDGLATPSLEHGVTVVIGNCSLSLLADQSGRRAK
jgi:N-acyl-D-aspartate/D-glutamate deacylase